MTGKEFKVKVLELKPYFKDTNWSIVDIAFWLNVACAQKLYYVEQDTTAFGRYIDSDVVEVIFIKGSIRNIKKIFSSFIEEHPNVKLLQAKRIRERFKIYPISKLKKLL